MSNAQMQYCALRLPISAKSQNIEKKKEEASKY